MKKLGIFIGFLVGAVVLQFLFTGWWKGEKINFFLVLVVFWAWFRGWKEGLIVGFIAGFLKDIFFSPLLGLNAFSLCLIGFLMGNIKEKIYQENILVFLLGAGIVSTIGLALISLWLSLFYRFSFLRNFSSSLFPSLLYNCGLCFFIFLIKEGLIKSKL